MTVPGGWLRFNGTMHKLDAHCNRHGPKCKMDGSLAKGNIGHCLAWLIIVLYKFKLLTIKQKLLCCYILKRTRPYKGTKERLGKGSK